MLSKKRFVCMLLNLSFSRLSQRLPQRDRRIQAYLDVQNAQRFHARGLHSEIVVDDGVWIVLSRTASSATPTTPAASATPVHEQQESGPGRAARGSSDTHQQRASLASTTAVLGSEDIAGSRDANGGAADAPTEEEEVDEEDEDVAGFEEGRKRKRDSLFLSSSVPAYAPIL